VVLGLGCGVTRVSREMWDEEFQRAAVVSESCCGFGQLNVWIKEQNSRLKGRIYIGQLKVWIKEQNSRLKGRIYKF